MLEKRDLRHSMANIKRYKSRSSHNFSDIVNLYFQKLCDLENIGQCHDVQHSHWRYLMACVNLYKRHTGAFFTSTCRLPDIKYYMISRNIDLEDIGQGHDV